MIGAILASAIPAVVGGLIGNQGAKQTAANNAAEAAKARDFTREQMTNRHQWEVADLKKAGLNPLLSAGGTPSVGASPVAAPTDYASSRSNSARQISEAFLARANLANQTKIANSQANANNATAAKEMAQADLFKDQLAKDFYGAQTTNFLSSAEHFKSSANHLDSLIPQVAQNIKESEQRVEESGERIRLLRARVSEARSSTARNYALAALHEAEEFHEYRTSELDTYRSIGAKIEAELLGRKRGESYNYDVFSRSKLGSFLQQTFGRGGITKGLSTISNSAGSLKYLLRGLF